MKDEPWRMLTDCPRAEASEEAVLILVWHVFNGVMVTDTLHVWENRFHVYWKPMPKKWIRPENGLPTAQDADAQRCIVCVEKRGEVRMKGWYQVTVDGDVQAWIPCPDPPPDAKELRHKAW